MNNKDQLSKLEKDNFYIVTYENGPITESKYLKFLHVMRTRRGSLSAVFENVELLGRSETIFINPENIINVSKLEKTKYTRDTIIVSIKTANREYRVTPEWDNPYSIHKIVDFSDNKKDVYNCYNKYGRLLHEIIDVPMEVEYGWDEDELL